jgi:L-ascorbate metabolism protein UlaG (beta-lactamase superfamily)
MKFTYYGHSCFLIETGGYKLLFDPFISPNPLAKNINVPDIKADYILVSHGHEDHTADLLTIASLNQAKIICSWEVMLWLQREGYTNVHPMNAGGGFNFDFGRVKCTIAQHSSSMADGTYAGNPHGFLVTTPDNSFYYSGDTGLTLDMQLIPRWAKLDFAIMPIGDNFTMNAADAAVAAEFVKTNKVIGVHYDTFGFIVVDHAAAKKSFEEKGLTLLLPAIGETIEV